MMLRDKRGQIKFVAFSPKTGEHFVIDPRETLTSWQNRKMSTRPFLIVQFAHYLANDLKKSGHEGFEIRAISRVSLNHRPLQPSIDREIDLSKETFYDWKPNRWIQPFEDTVIPRP